MNVEGYWPVSIERGSSCVSCLQSWAWRLISAGSVHATARLIPTDKTLPPLAMTAHAVTVSIDEQVAVTHIEQTFHNHTSRQLEATYYLPVPKGANVKRFSMWVDGKEVPGELVEAAKARKIYTDIVQRTMDPGLLEYMDNSLLKMRIFPVPPNGDQKITLTLHLGQPERKQPGRIRLSDEVLRQQGVRQPGEVLA